MTGFLSDSFLLDTPQAEHLYHEIAAPLPIIDYHNHLDPQAILTDRHWADLGEIWLEGDHYKWRAMRWHGIDEARVTGAASFRAKFDAFAETLPNCLGNPLYHWSHLEMRRYFDWHGVLGPHTADAAWQAAATRLSQPGYGAQGLLRQMNVGFVGTTDDPCDDLAAHQTLAQGDIGFTVAPSFRPDPAFKLNAPDYGAYLDRLSDASGVTIHGFDTLIEALVSRLDAFVQAGCRASDHGLDTLAPFGPLTGTARDQLMDRARRGKAITAQEQADFQAAVLIELGQAYAARDLVMQFHIGGLRNANTRMHQNLGADIGCDSISDAPLAQPLNALLDAIAVAGGLPRTIIYALDPTKLETVVTTVGNFQGGGPGRVQAGAAWWFNDQLDGMDRQLTQLAQMGLLSHFVGMLTDSRSFLSFPRHEYYRRLLCGMVGRWMASGHVPDDLSLTEPLIRRTCYETARDWFT